MFICPNDRRALSRRSGPHGMFWLCAGCGGRLVGLGVLRRTTAQPHIDRIWRQAREATTRGGRPCPSCTEPMVEVPSGPDGAGPMVDVCRICHVVWFDPREFEQMPAVPQPVEAAIPQRAEERAKEILATAQAEAIAARSQRDYGSEAPAEWWKYLPGFFGMPVEYEQGRFKEVPWATWMLIVFIAAFSIRAFFSLEGAVERFGLIPALATRYYGLTFLTAFLLHGDIFHLFGNMYFLFVFGDNVEDYLGKARYAALILLAAIAGDIAHIAIDPRSNIPLIGASGGISGIIAFYALKFPKARLGILFRIGIIPLRWFRIPAYAFVGFWIALQLVGAYLQVAGASSVSSLAHLGGAATGLVFWLTYRQT